jgi:hypothetical protein
VKSVPLAVGLARDDLAEAAFALQVTIDDTSLWGGEPATDRALAAQAIKRAKALALDAGTPQGAQR